MSTSLQYRFTLFVVESNSSNALAGELHQALTDSLPAGSWEMEVINVLDLPEKAVQNDIFATPTVVRHLPEPIKKLLVNASQLSDLLVAVIDPEGGEGQVV